MERQACCSECPTPVRVTIRVAAGPAMLVAVRPAPRHHRRTGRPCRAQLHKCAAAASPLQVCRGVRVHGFSSTREPLHRMELKLARARVCVCVRACVCAPGCCPRRLPASPAP